MAAEEQQPRRRGGSLSRRRPSSQLLDPLLIPDRAENGDISWQVVNGAHVANGNTTEDDVIAEGEELFNNFIAEQIERESPEKLDEVEIKTPVQYRFPVWKRTGRSLRLLADEFARTKERERVREQAQGIRGDMSYEEFCILLDELFRGEGVTGERIVTLFYFCSDVAIRFLKTGVDLFKRFMGWSLHFIKEKVCSWVHRHGGWNKVLQIPFSSWKRVAVMGSIMLLLVFGFRYWRRRV